MGVERFLRLFDFFSVLLRAGTLIFQTLVIGGIVFLVAVLRDSGAQSGDLAQTMRRWLRAFALALAATQAGYLSANLFILVASAEIPLGEAIGANFALAAILLISTALVVAVVCSGARWHGSPAMLLPAALILAASVMTSHSTARMDNRPLLAAFTALHQAATAAWIGGLPFLVLVLARARASDLARDVSRRFSALALASVALLALSGLGLSFNYVDTWAFYETAYGVMVAAKVSLFACLLALGALNYFAVRAAREKQETSLTRVLSFGQAEIGIGLTVVLAAASLTSQPPAVDLTADRLSWKEIAARMTPTWPRFSTPALHELPLTAYAAASGTAQQAYVPASTPGASPSATSQSATEIAWSEYNHHWAGLLVFVMGLLALLHRTGRFPLARNWPLVFIGLAVFLFFRADPEAWPLGPQGFWESWLNPEDLQHRFFVLLIVAFAVFEWRVQTGRVTALAPKLVFPAVCALAGAALLTHSHSLGNVKEELLAELSHTPIAVAGVLAGWSRWLELRLPGEDRVKPALSWIWPVCFILVGAFLLNYREA